MKLHFSGKQAFLLGGTCQLALNLAEQLMRNDIEPTLTYRNDAGEKRIAERLAPLALPYRTFLLDLAQPASLDACAQIEPVPEFIIDFAQDDLTTLVASASPAEIDAYFTAQVTARARVIREMVRIQLRNRRGRMVFISSTAAEQPNPGQGFYAAAKCAVEALYRNIGLELGQRGLTTVILRPGYIDSGRGRRYAEAHQTEIIARTPIKRLLSVTEVTETILFLLSDSASGFNAATLHLDGGLTAGK